MASKVESTSTGLHRCLIVAPPYVHQLIPCQTVVRPARVGATSALLRDTPWPNREDTVSPPWTQPMLVYYGFTWWSYDGETDYAGRATVMPQISPE
jgi:hypothetical protein